MTVIQSFVATVAAAIASINTSVDNVVADEVNLNKQIQDLKAQLAAASGGMTVEDKAALDAVTVAMQTLDTRVKTVAASVVDLPAPPTI